MCPNPIPESPGCLSILLHAGTRGPAVECIDLKDGSKLVLPTAGTSDPDEWGHVLWFGGKAWAATLKCDLPGHRPSFEELAAHFDTCPDIWSPVMPMAHP